MINIGSREEGAIGILSNFTANEFIFDGVHCASMEGFLQSLKFEDSDKQLAVCGMVGLKAKRKGQKRNKAWKSQQTLWWKGRAIARQSQEFSDLLCSAFTALSENESFRNALMSTGEEDLEHTMGSQDPRNTVLTEQEFCFTLMWLREKIREAQHDLQDWLNEVSYMPTFIKLSDARRIPGSFEPDPAVWLEQIVVLQKSNHKVRSVHERYFSNAEYLRDLVTFAWPEVRVLNQLAIQLQSAIDNEHCDAIPHRINEMYSVCYNGKNLPFPSL